MFSGIVETTSSILKIEDTRAQRSVWICKPRGWRLRLGESVCVEGVCSTVQAQNRSAFQVIYMHETLRRSACGELSAGSVVNLERSLTLQSLIGGHLVQGHVDSPAKITRIESDGAAKVYEFALPRRFSRYIVEKGSIAVDGVSLTVVDSRLGRFTVSLLEHTLSHTTLGSKGRGRRVNIEVDILAKYTERLLAR